MDEWMGLRLVELDRGGAGGVGGGLYVLGTVELCRGFGRWDFCGLGFREHDGLKYSELGSMI